MKLLRWRKPDQSPLPQTDGGMRYISQNLVLANPQQIDVMDLEGYN